MNFEHCSGSVCVNVTRAAKIRHSTASGQGLRWALVTRRTALSPLLAVPLPAAAGVATAQDAGAFADPARRALALSELLDDPQAAARLVHAAWADAKPPPRDWLLLTLGFARAVDPQSSALLLGALADPDLRRAAVRALLPAGAAAWPVLCAGLKRGPDDFWVATCLAGSECPEAKILIPALLEAKGGTDAGRANQARRALLEVQGTRSEFRPLDWLEPPDLLA